MSIDTGGLFKQQHKDILIDVGMHIAPGQFVGILGASGSGKSTPIKAIAGFGDTAGGRILLDGQAVTAHDLQQDLRIVYLPQDVVIHEEITVRCVLGYIVELKGIARASIPQVVVDVSKCTGLIDYLDVQIRRLPGGQRKRAALAGELIGDPRPILLDEATAGLDPATEAEIMRLFRSLADEGCTVICITHFPNRLALCDHLIYLMDARIVFVGPPAELQQQFGTRSIEEIYLAQANRGAAQWQQQYEATAVGRAATLRYSARAGRTYCCRFSRRRPLVPWLL